MIYVGIDNGVSGAIAYYNNDKMYIKELPIKNTQNYTKKVEFVNKIDFVELRKIFCDLIGTGKVIKVLWERPFCNPMMFKATLSSMLSYQTTLDVLESLNIPYEMIDSKVWQTKLLPKGIYKITQDKNGKNRIKADKKMLKKASIDTANRLYPYLQIKKDGQADAVMICEYLRRKELGIK
jgi:hypothetical protein